MQLELQGVSRTEEHRPRWAVLYIAPFTPKSLELAEAAVRPMRCPHHITIPIVRLAAPRFVSESMSLALYATNQAGLVMSRRRTPGSRVAIIADRPFWGAGLPHTRASCPARASSACRWGSGEAEPRVRPSLSGVVLVHLGHPIASISCRTRTNTTLRHAIVCLHRCGSVGAVRATIMTQAYSS